jgi:glutamate decarboxylase
MGKHGKSEIRALPGNGLSEASRLSMPARQSIFPQSETQSAAAYQIVHEQLLPGENSRRNLATFCQVWPDPELRQLMSECMDRNLFDRSEHPHIAELESHCIHMIADLWNSLDAANALGCSTTGSSEAAMLGALALKRRWQRKHGRRANEKQLNLVCGPVQICWHKLARYFDLELREIPCERNSLMMSPEEVVKRCDENTIGVVPTFGVTFTLQYEPVQAVADALDDFEEQSGLDIPIHVDAASGGFVAPFVHPSVIWDFRIPRVKSINASGHKFGLAPLGCGWIIWREPHDFPEDLIFGVKYLGGNMQTLALTFSRPGGQIASQYYNFLRLGREGYTRVTQGCLDVGAWISDEIAKFEDLDIVYDGRGGVPGCCWTMAGSKDSGFDLYDLSDQLRLSGWHIPAYPMPPNRSDLVVQRVLARFCFSRDLAERLVRDLDSAIRHFEKPTSPRSFARPAAELSRAARCSSFED